MRSGNCPKCNSSKVLRNARVIDRNGEYALGDLSVRTERNPKAIMFKGGEEFALVACVCCACGYTELYVKNPEELWLESQNKTN